MTQYYIVFYPKILYKFKSNQNSNRIFFIFGRLALKFMWKNKYTKITKTILERKSKEEELISPDIQYFGNL